MLEEDWQVRYCGTMMTDHERRYWERQRERAVRGSPWGCIGPAAIGATLSFVLMLPVSVAIVLSDDGSGEPAGRWGTGLVAILLPMFTVPFGAVLGLVVAAIFRRYSGVPEDSPRNRTAATNDRPKRDARGG